VRENLKQALEPSGTVRGDLRRWERAMKQKKQGRCRGVPGREAVPMHWKAYFRREKGRSRGSGGWRKKAGKMNRKEAVPQAYGSCDV